MRTSHNTNKTNKALRHTKLEQHKHSSASPFCPTAHLTTRGANFTMTSSGSENTPGIIFNPFSGCASSIYHTVSNLLHIPLIAYCLPQSS